MTAATNKHWATELERMKQEDKRVFDDSVKKTVAQSNAAIRKERQQTAQFNSWDKLIQSEEFRLFVIDRGLTITKHHPVPYSLEMEAAAIGAMLLLDDGAVTRGMKMLHRNHFYNSLLLNVFDAIAQLMRKREIKARQDLQHIDIVSVAEQMKRNGTEVNTCQLTACIEACPSSANIEYYISKVIEYSRLRYQRRLAEKVEEMASLPDAEAEQIRNAANNALQAISTHGWCDLKAIFDQKK